MTEQTDNLGTQTQNKTAAAGTSGLKLVVLTSPNQWFIPYASELASYFACPLMFKHEDIGSDVDIVFILSYHRIIPESYLKQHRYNIVIHAADLPQGKGWAPLFWQVLEGKNDIVFTLFEADAATDNGPYYSKKVLHLTGFELNAELREKQAQMCIEMCKDFVEHYAELTAHEQSGESTFYPKRGPADSELDLQSSLGEQFNLLRIVDNDSYPAFFVKDGHRYILKIYHG